MKITINKKHNVNEITRPFNLFGVKEKYLYVMCDQYGMVTDVNPTYFMTTGINSCPVMIWFNVDTSSYEIASTSQKDLKEYNAHVFTKLCKNARANLVIDIE